MNLDKTCRKISKNLNEDYETVKNIVMYEWLFAKRIMQNETDTRDILFNKLFKFKLKSRFKNDKLKNYSPHEDISYNKK